MQIYNFNASELPTHYKWQIISFMRVQWSDGFTGENQFRDWITHEHQHPIHFLLTENDLLISYVGVVWKELEHEETKYKTYGLSGVFTYPSFRNQGYGLKLVNKVKEYIESQDGDIVLFTTKQIGFYEKAGFEYMEKVKIYEGGIENTNEYGERVYMLFLTDKGKAGRVDFENKPIYFGESMW